MADKILMDVSSKFYYQFLGATANGVGFGEKGYLSVFLLFFTAEDAENGRK